ncbi:COX15/CtaA family protein [Paenibacillus crassostreae]|uniref:Cytochrome Caa3 oxidase n=1 Tax=Paenibacillus crassostreae TaxID=1763538 RepID=A0A167GQU5_9BACL|nr:COX15/CtaA family protein [Paenibacillus crassostreae]AOZ92011.1 heme A synthase [Paenibacillus crassostreae]OAB77818.1 cytochrome Caa3 oxidase [Paenibacillus crassostreae]
MNTKQLKWLSYLTFFVMFFATFGGTVVTRTGSGLGCGHEFPLCHGKFIPAHTVESLIEYSHRLVSGLAGLLALAVVIAFYLFNKRRDLRVYSVMTLIFVLVQATMGALAVLYDQSSAVKALHFGFSLIAFASALMLALGIRRVHKAKNDLEDVMLPRVSRSFRNITWITTIYCYVVVYVGAFVSHSGSAGGCSGWPLCNGEWFPELTGGVKIAFLHRLAALLLFILIAIMGHLAYHRNHGNRELQMLGITAVVLCLMQVLSGAGLMYTMGNDEVYIFASLLHNLLVSSLFGVLCYLCVRVWQLNKK